jgi:WD40 repeat protein
VGKLGLIWLLVMGGLPLSLKAKNLPLSSLRKLTKLNCCYMNRLLFLFITLFHLNYCLFAQKMELMIPSGSGSMASIAYTADEKILFTGGGLSNTEIKVWDVKSGRLLKTLTHPDAGQLVSIPNTQSIAFFGFNSGKLHIVSAPDFKPRLVASLPYGVTCNKLEATPDGKSVLVGGSNFIGQMRCPFIYKVDLSNGNYTVLMKVEPYTTDQKVIFSFSEMNMTTDGRYILARTHSLNQLQPPHAHYVIDANTGAVVKNPTGGYYYICGNKLLKITATKIDDKNNAYFASLVSLPDFTEGASNKLEKFVGTFSQFSRSDYLFDENQHILTHTIAGNIVKLDVKTGKIVQRMFPIEEEENITLSSASYLPKSKKIIVEFSSAKYGVGLNVIDANTLKSEVILGNVFPHIGNTIFYNPAVDALVVNSSEIKVLEIGKNSGNIKSHQIDLQSKQYIGKEGKAAWSPDGSTLAYFDNNKQEIGIFDAKNLSAKPKTAPYSAKIISLGSPLIWSPDSKKFIYGTLNNFLETDVPSLTARTRYIGSVGYQSQHNIFSKNGQFIIQPAYRYDNGQNFIGSETNFLVCYNVATGSKIWESTYTAKGGLLPITFIDNDKTLVAIEGQTRTLQYFDAQTGQLKGSYGEPVDISKVTLYLFPLINSTHVSYDGTKCLVWGEGKIMVYDVVNKSKIAEIPNNTTLLNGVCFLRNDKFIAYCAQKAIRIIEISKQKEVASITLFNQNNEWIVTTPEGRFEASPKAQDWMYYVKGDQTLPLSALFEKFYTPKLLARILDGENFEPVPVDVNTLKAAPTVKISLDNTSRNLIVADDNVTVIVEKEQINIRVQAECPNDAVTEIRLYQNGKLVETTRNLVVDDDTKGEISLTKTFAVTLNEGENTFKAFAYNTQRTESQAAELIVNFRTPKSSSVPKPNTPPLEGGGLEGGIQLHLVVIGINKYKNPKHNLNYAIADASSFKEIIEKNSNAIFSKTNVVFIADENATKTNVTTELDKIKSTATSKDVFIFYYAGHGVMNDKKEFYLVPHDVIQLYGNDGALAQKGLSANQLQQYSKDIKAQKQLFILDACQSAAALGDVVASRGAAEEKAIAQLARATGTYWLTASGSEQFASEFAQLGHGTFTYVLLEALSGKADTGDKKITVKEIDSYLQEHVPEVTAKHKGSPQYPASYGYGNDFPIRVVKN